MIAGYADGDRALTPRMREALDGVARGETTRQTADRLGLGETTLRTILSAARGRLEAGSSAAAAAIAVRKGLL
jgi:two-component system, NarL family, response regulator YdfI